MSEPGLQRVSVFRWDGRTLREERSGSPPRDVPAQNMVIERVRASERVRNAVGKVLRWSGALLMFSPLTIIPKLFIPSSIRWVSDGLTVVFVCVVVLFFATLNLFFIVSLLWWARRGPAGARLATAKELAFEGASADGTSVGARVRVDGVVVPILATTAEVLRRADLRDTTLQFVIEASTFAVVPREGTPVIVLRSAIPVFTTQGKEAGVSVALSLSAQALARPLEALQADSWELRAGERVIVLGTVSRMVENADHFEVDGEHASLPREGGPKADPYRRGPGGPAVIIGEDTLVLVTPNRT